MKIIVIEEHHELYKEVVNSNSGDVFTLVNFDEHSDFFAPIISPKLLDSSEDSDVSLMTYTELRISDFIVPLFYKRIIDKYYWVNNLEYRYSNKFLISTEKLFDNRVKLDVIFDSKSGDYYFEALYFEDVLELSNITDNLILSVDLDFFYSNDLLGEKIIFEITEDEYNKYNEDKYHVFRLSYGSRFRTFVKEKKFYGEILEERKQVVKEKLIDNLSSSRKFNIIKRFISNNKNKIKFLFLCKSVKSGYMDDHFAKKLLNVFWEEIIHD